MKEGEDKIDKAITGIGKNINGWTVGGLAGGDRASFAGDWLKRAAVAKAGIYANDPIEATYPLTRKDSSGETLDGSKHAYTLTFTKGELPPVNAFWSVTMYDGKTQLLIENPINRYLINSPMLPGMKKNPDGSLTIYIQNKSPARQGEGSQLATRTGRTDLSGHAPVLAQDRTTVDSAARRRHVAASRHHRCLQIAARNENANQQLNSV